MKPRGFHGPVGPVTPRRERVQGLPAFASIAALPEAPDAAIVAVPVDAALEAVEELGRKGCKAAIVFTAGFAEVDEAGARAQAALVDTAQTHGMRLLGPNCLGLFNAAICHFPIFSIFLRERLAASGPDRHRLAVRRLRHALVRNCARPGPGHPGPRHYRQ